MKRIIFKESEETINLDQVYDGIPIFLVQNGIVKGVLLCYKEGWIVKTGASDNTDSCFVYHTTRELAMQKALFIDERYEFYIDPEIKPKS